MAIIEGKNCEYKVCDECNEYGHSRYIRLSGYFTEDEDEEVCLECFKKILDEVGE